MIELTYDQYPTQITHHIICIWPIISLPTWHTLPGLLLPTAETNLLLSFIQVKREAKSIYSRWPEHYSNPININNQLLLGISSFPSIKASISVAPRHDALMPS